MATEDRKMKATGLLTNEVQNGTSLARSYDSLGRPTGYTLSLCASASPREDFAYDPIGNRVSSTDYDETGAARTSTYTANNLNQYTARTVPGWASVRGLADADATVAAPGAVLDVLPPSARPRGNAPRGGDVRGQARLRRVRREPEQDS